MTDRDLFFGTSGPPDAEIVLVGEAWGEQESFEQKPFVGSSGTELTRILSEAGLDRSQVLMTNVAAVRPQSNEMWRLFHAKDENRSSVRNLHPTDLLMSELSRLYRQIRFRPRRLVIATGNYALWALGGHGGFDTPKDAGGRRVPTGIINWRGSMSYMLDGPEADAAPLTTSPREGGVKLLPIVHPAAIMRQWSLRATAVHDLKARVPMALRDDWRRRPTPTFTLAYNFDDLVAILCSYLAEASRRPDGYPMVLDVETKSPWTTVVGLADSASSAVAIPFVRGGDMQPFWTFEQERQIVSLLLRLLMHSNVRWIGQNFSYDIQILFEWLGVAPKMWFDTMLAHHLCFPGTPKALEYISSLYCTYHWFWKEDSKEWDTKHTGLEELLTYNCLDCIQTFEAAEELQRIIPSLGFSHLWEERKAVHNLALGMMWRGTLVDKKQRASAGLRLMEQSEEIIGQLERIIPQSWIETKSKVKWWSSAHQQKQLFSEVLGLNVPRHRKTGSPTLGAEGLEILRGRYPELRLLFDLIESLRSLETFNSHFVRAPLEPNGRMRCSFNTAGTETFRWSSSKNPFYRGTNLQNIPEGTEDKQ